VDGQKPDVTDIRDIPYRDTHFAERALEIERRRDGTLILRSGYELDSYPTQLSEWLRHWAATAPDRLFLAERDPQGEWPGDWRGLTYADMRAAVDRVSQALLDLGLNANRPVMTLGENSLDMAVLMLAAMQVGIPFAPVSPSYSLLSDDFGKLKYVFDMVKPGLIYTPSAGRYAKALEALATKLVAENVIRVSSDPGQGDMPFEDLKAAEPDERLAAAYDAVTGDTVVKLLFTSGSTGMPKAVMTTQRMMCANVTAVAQVLPVLDDHPPVIVDWLPWNHVAGGNKNVNLILRCGGTLYIDGGSPRPGQFETTLRNLRDVQPTFMHNVPLVYETLCPYLEDDPEFARHLFEKIDFIFYAAAPMPAPLQARLDAVSAAAVGARLPFLSSLGSTETTPSSILCHWPSEVPGNLGLPLPGVEIKLAPTAEKLEMRVKGPNVTPGYLGDDETTAQANAKAFDDEGFYRMGDAVRFADPLRPEEGLVFDGRITENFKLNTGTWVQTGTVRIEAVAALAPYARDAAVTGEGRAELGLLLFLNEAACAKALGIAESTPLTKFLHNPALKPLLANQISTYNQGARGSSRQIRRLMIMTEAPSVSGHEITDKGYLNQRAVLARRASLVERLYAAGPETRANDVILITD